MNYKRVSLRPIHGNLALKFLNWVIKQPTFQQLKNLTYVYCIIVLIIVKARMYASAKSIFTQSSDMGIDSNSIFAALMDTYPLCNSNPTILCLVCISKREDGCLVFDRGIHGYLFLVFLTGNECRCVLTIQLTFVFVVDGSSSEDELQALKNELLLILLEFILYRCFEEANIDVEKEENIENESVLFHNVLCYNV
ncbi:unnamed protein product [Lactuca saligna]|uniref:Uncharacterized protein n=1 Tax=Lactuca saligna TaxID=75948 RepID=A0AA35Y9D4_LACSI|nr:unnamed protein product [Lactuca saligna]